MTCFVCKEYGSKTIRPFVQGSKTLRKPSLKTHEKLDGHINNCKREYAKTNLSNTLAAKTLQTLNLKTVNHLQLKFRDVHFLCKLGKPFTDYLKLCQLDEAKALVIGSQYRSEKSAIAFPKYIAEAESETIRKNLQTCKFISVISTDCSHQEA